MSSPRDRALAYLNAHTVVTLATQGPYGIWAAALFYATDHFSLYFLSAEHTRHARNIAADPRVAATVQENYRDWPGIQGIQLEGTVSKLEGAERIAAISRYEDVYPFIVQPIPHLVRALKKVNWYRIDPERLYFVDNTQGFGHRDEIDLHS